MFTLYKIYFGESLAYLGRTRQPLNQRLRGHFFKKKLHKAIDIHKVTAIEHACFATCADMYLYEIYYINKLHPLLNKDDVAPDDLTIQLPDVAFIPYECALLDKWKLEITHIKEELSHRRKQQREARRQASIEKKQP